MSVLRIILSDNHQRNGAHRHEGAEEIRDKVIMTKLAARLTVGNLLDHAKEHRENESGNRAIHAKAADAADAIYEQRDDQTHGKMNPLILRDSEQKV